MVVGGKFMLLLMMMMTSLIESEVVVETSPHGLFCSATQKGGVEKKQTETCPFFSSSSFSVSGSGLFNRLVVIIP